MNLPIRIHGKKSPLTQEAWDQFFGSGYCIGRGIFNSFEISNLKLALQDIERMACGLAESPELESLIEHKITYKGAQFVITTQDNQLHQLKRVVGCGSAHNLLLEASRKPQLLNAFSDLLLSQRMEQIICQFHPKRPGDDVAFSPHRDIEHRLNYDSQWQDVNGFGSYAIGMIAIDPSNEHNGGLHVVPESHHGVSHESVIKASEEFKENWSLRAFAPKLESGDVLFMHPYLVHWSSPNKSDQSRLSLLSGMCSVGANSGEYPGDCTNEILDARDIQKPT